MSSAHLIPLQNHIIHTTSLRPSQQWLTSFLSTQKPTTPLPAIQKTALFRLLASDITTSLAQPAEASQKDGSDGCFPAGITDPSVQERRLPGPIAVQVLGIEDMGRSRWEQVEAMESLERGEGMKGREVIRLVPDDQDDGGAERQGTQKTAAAAAAAQLGAGGGRGPHKLLLQDARGKRVWAIELEKINGVGLATTSIGSKVVLRNVLVARGVVLLEKATVQALGGKIEALHNAWVKGRKNELLAAVRSTVSDD